jgi:hypothetical protein
MLKDVVTRNVALVLERLERYVAQRQDSASVLVELCPVIDDCLADSLKILNFLISEIAQQFAKTLVEFFLPIALVGAVRTKLHQDLII